jgi:hypothetical protein
LGKVDLISIYSIGLPVKLSTINIVKKNPFPKRKIMRSEEISSSQKSLELSGRLLV